MSFSLDSLGSLGWYSTAEIIKVVCGQLRQVFCLFPLCKKVKNEVSRVMLTNDPNRSSLSSCSISPSSFKIGFVTKSSPKNYYYACKVDG